VSTSLPAPTPRPQPSGQPVDGLALWDRESASARPGALSALRLDANERLVIPFTTSMVRQALHYLSDPDLRGYVHCLGADCLLCRVGRQPEVRDLWPVYDVQSRAVAVLPISPNLRPWALRPQLAPLLRQLQQGSGQLVIGIRRQDAGRFTVASYAPREGADDGAAAVRAFREQFDAGRVDLAGVFPRLANEELARLPEVAVAMRTRGIQA
jgi:hypothetical protein